MQLNFDIFLLKRTDIFLHVDASRQRSSKRECNPQHVDASLRTTTPCSTANVYAYTCVYIFMCFDITNSLGSISKCTGVIHCDRNSFHSGFRLCIYIWLSIAAGILSTPGFFSVYIFGALCVRHHVAAADCCVNSMQQCDMENDFEDWR